ncbi:MAG: FAD-binding oxidoreductase [Crocosphaera sp.]|nr:FAD-binding oxidoreductase [Crocosphaera sp.]
MNNFDWIVIGGGITGSILSYELAKKGLNVLLLEKNPNYHNATRYSYGGVAYWSGTDEFSLNLCQESKKNYEHLSEELEQDIEFRELDLMLTIPVEKDPQLIAKNYDKFAITPNLLTPKEALEIEPLLNQNAISGVLKLPHGNLHPQKTNDAYQQGFLRLGGTRKYEEVTTLLGKNQTIIGVQTNQNKYYAKNTVICAGGLSRFLLNKMDIALNIYFTHSQLIITPPVEIKLKSLVMPAILNRINIEEKSGDSTFKNLWNAPSDEVIDDVMEVGAIQFLDGSFCLGQISKIKTNPWASNNDNLDEKIIREGIGKVLPTLQDLPGKLHHCLVAFSADTNFLVGKINHFTGLHLFSGFTSTFIFAPPLAKRFASWATEDYQKMPSLSS